MCMCVCLCVRLCALVCSFQNAALSCGADRWNLNMLPQLEGSVLSHLDENINGNTMRVSERNI
jgi:hypothetical protein